MEVEKLVMNVELEECNNQLLVALEGEIDVNNVSQFRKKLVSNIEEAGTEIILNCEGLSYIDSTGLGVLVSVLKEVQQHGGSIRIVALKPYLRRIFEVTNLTELFDIEVDD